MRKSNNLSKKVSVIFLLALIGILLILKRIFVFKGECLKELCYKSNNLIVQPLKKGKSEKKTVVVLGNGWNVSVDSNNKVTKHDPFFLIPKAEVKLLEEKGYEILTAYFPFECSGIEHSGWELAQFINDNYKDYQIILLGHSKSGVCFANLCKWLEADNEDITVVTVSAPYGGVKSDKENLQKLNTFQKWLYPQIIVGHRTNDDITKNSNFLNEVADFSGLSTVNFYCVRSVLPNHPFMPIDILLKWTDNKFEINGDGIVGINEQQPPIQAKEEFMIEASHQSSMQKAIKLLISKDIL